VKNGIYAVNFGGGQVDITSGKYVFECTEAYLIENGKSGAPIKGAMLIGNGPTDLNRISMVGNDLALDDGIGTCGKNGQGVPVGVGQPTLRIDRRFEECGITVGGTGWVFPSRHPAPREEGAASPSYRVRLCCRWSPRRLLGGRCRRPAIAQDRCLCRSAWW
jgi:hypothetical protein